MDTNSSLQEKVLEELQWDPSIDAEHIGVTALDGIVTLTGYVKHYIDKKNAERAAKRVVNVKAVVDEIELQLAGSSQKTDLEIAESALAALKLNMSIPHDAIKLTVDNGWVTLDGKVDWNYQRLAAENTVKLMLGVKGITNKLAVKPMVCAADIKSKIQSALVRNAQFDANHITVDIRGEKAILGGSVRSWSEREQAATAVWSAPGITEVENNIRIG